MHDWNGDGKKDLLDNMIEYEGYRQFTSSEDESTPQKHTYSSTGDISIFGAIAITIVSMLASGWVCMTLKIESGLVIIILWIVFAVLLFLAVSAIKKSK